MTRDRAASLSVTSHGHPGGQVDSEVAVAAGAAGATRPRPDLEPERQLPRRAAAPRARAPAAGLPVTVGVTVIDSLAGSESVPRLTVTCRPPESGYPWHDHDHDFIYH